jgi:hypothetical protein
MAELIACPKCRQALQVPTQYLGETVQCPECQDRFTATASATSISTKPTATAPAATRERSDDDDFGDIRISRRDRSDLDPHRGPAACCSGCPWLPGRLRGCLAPWTFEPCATGTWIPEVST